METEIKLSLDPAARASVESHPALAAARSQKGREITTYYDTPDLLLRERGASLRVRRSGRTYVQTVKATPDAGRGAATSREEWEWPVASGEIDGTLIADHPQAKHLLVDVLDAVQPVFVTDIRRTKRLLEVAGATRVEAVIDEGVVRVGTRTRPICEVELELKGGPPAPLFRLAAELAARAALRLGSLSKAERGYELMSAKPRPDAVARALELPRHVSVGEAFPVMVAASLREFVANLAMAGQGDVDGVHRLRAAIRKLRTLLVLFAPVLDRGEAARFNALLRGFGAVLGRCRDWDVFLIETLPAAGPTIGADAVARLREAALPKSGEAQAAVRDAIAGPTPTELVLGLSAWASDRPWQAGADPGLTMRSAGSSLLSRLARKVEKRGKHPGALDPESLHELRKALKKVRYGVEDLESLFRAKAVASYLKGCKKMLQSLGDINDMAVTAAHVPELSARGGTDIAEPAAALLAWTETRRADALAHCVTCWRRLRRLQPFWA